jgi:hypothetical protein
LDQRDCIVTEETQVATRLPFSKGRKLDLDVDKMLAELRLEREQIEEAILTLERLARGRGRRRGRPPAWLKEASAQGSTEENTDHPAPEPKRRGRPPGPAKTNKHSASSET